MGREVETYAEWQGLSGRAKALLESTEIILRGDVKAKLRRSEIVSMSIDDEVLHLRSRQDEMRLQMGKTEAQKWLDILSKSPPTLASKLGVSKVQPAFLIGEFQDPALLEALSDVVAGSAEEAKMLIAMTTRPQDLAKAVNVAKAHPTLPIWCIHGKGPKAQVGDNAVRNLLRENGYVDSKSCAVSDMLSATRYGRRKD